MRILYHSGSPHIKTGYGRVTREVATRLHNSGEHEVAIQAMNAIVDYDIWWHGEEFNGEIREPMKIYSTGSKSPFGIRDVQDSYEDFGADFYFTHFDTWMRVARNSIPNMGVPYASYVIVDHYPAPNAVTKQVENAQGVIAMSEFAKHALEEKGIRPIQIPHGVDIDNFYPLDKPPNTLELTTSDGDIREVDIDETFIVGMVAANFGDRKRIPEQMEAFNTFLNTVDDDAVLHIHTEQNPESGFNLREIQKEIGIPDRNLSVPAGDDYHGIGDQVLNAWYNAFDVLLNCSMGESWGLTITEAQAAGTPTIVTNFSSMPEQLGVDIPYRDNLEDTEYDKVMKAPHGLVVEPATGVYREKVSAKQYIVNPRDVWKALEWYYERPGQVKSDGEAAAKYVRDNYTWDRHVVPAFKTFFDRMEDELT